MRPFKQPWVIDRNQYPKENVKWKINRLMFLWDVSGYNVDAFISRGLAEELEYLERDKDLVKSAMLQWMDSPYQIIDGGNSRFMTSFC